MDKIKFLGIGSAFNPLWGNNAAYYKNNNKLLLIDCGETNFERILRKKLLDGIDNVYILITHLHPDHVGSLGSLIFYLKFIKKIKAKVLYKDEVNIKTLLKIMGVEEEDYEMCKEFTEEDMKNMGIKNIEVYNIEHSTKLNSYGYKIRFNDDEVIFYTGDCKKIQKEIVEEVINNSINKIYIDCFPFDVEGIPHITINNLCKIFPEEYRNRVYGMHYDGEEVIKLLLKNNFRIVEIK